jgi:phage terminase large subunit
MRLEISLTKKQTEFDRALQTYSKVFYGGAKGGGKSHGLRLIMLKRRIQYAGSTGYLFRQTYPELEANHITPLFEQFPWLQEHYNASKKTLYVPNGSKLRFAYVEHRKDLKKFQGREMQDLAIEEAGDWQFDHYEYLEKQRRSSIVGIPARTMLTGNPGGDGHQWLKRLFIDRRYDHGENPDAYHFIQALVEDNPALMRADPNYIKELESIRSDVLRRAWRHGDWNVQAGQFFDVRRDVHLIKPFQIPDHWHRFGSLDWGFNHPAFWGFWACDEDGNVYRTNTLCGNRMRPDEWAKRVKAVKDNARVAVWWAGHDCWVDKGLARTDASMGPTIAEQFQPHGIFLRPANIARKQGASQVRDYLACYDSEGKVTKPRVYWFDTPENQFSIDAVSRMTHNPDDIEDVLKVDSSDGDLESGDDGYDEFRYGLMSRPPVSRPLASPEHRGYRRSIRQATSSAWTV